MSPDLEALTLWGPRGAQTHQVWPHGNGWSYGTETWAQQPVCEAPVTLRASVAKLFSVTRARGRCHLQGEGHMDAGRWQEVVTCFLSHGVRRWGRGATARTHPSEAGVPGYVGLLKAGPSHAKAPKGPLLRCEHLAPPRNVQDPPQLGGLSAALPWPWGPWAAGGITCASWRSSTGECL